MKRAVAAVWVLGMLVVVAGTAFAYRDFYSEFNARVAHQQRRIDDGIRRGELSPPEVRELRDNLEYAIREEARARADGLLSPREQRRLMRILDDNDRMFREGRHSHRRHY
jgi:polyhydroxyalkanoate synthesis regulator phasin